VTDEGRQEEAEVGEDGEILDTIHDAGSLLQEASSVLHQLQNGWEEERRGEIDELWSQCEAEYGFVLARDAPGTPALGSLRARAGNGVAGLLGGIGKSSGLEEQRTDNGAVASPVESPAEIEADAAAEAARRDLQATRELRKRIEARLAATPQVVEEAATTSHVLSQRAACEDEADARRLASLRTEVERLRAKAKSLSTANAASTGSGSTVGSVAEADAIEPPTPTAAAAMKAVDLTAPELVALDEWMEDLRVLGSEGVLSREAVQDPQTPHGTSRERGQVKAVASPMRVRNTTGLRSPAAWHSPPSSPSKKEMARLAEQKALEWAAGQDSGRDRGNLSARSKSGQQSPSRRTPKMALSSTRGCLLGAAPTATETSKEPASAVERQLDDILNELDEIDRIHDDVCMLAHS